MVRILNELNKTSSNLSAWRDIETLVKATAKYRQADAPLYTWMQLWSQE